MAYFTELEIRIERRIRNTEGDFDKVAVSQKVSFERGQVPFGKEEDSTFTVEEAADLLRSIVIDKFDEWAAPKQAPRVVPRSVAKPQEPEYEDDQPPEEEPKQRRSLSPFKKKPQQ